MSYSFKYRLQSAPQARTDGSGCLDHDIYAIASSDGSTWYVVPGRHKTISVPFAELDAALEQTTNPLRSQAYKEALARNLNTAPVAVLGWTAAQLLLVVQSIADATATAVAVDEFIRSVAPNGIYPVDFSI